MSVPVNARYRPRDGARNLYNKNQLNINGTSESLAASPA